MARPRAKELTDRELEIMHVFWSRSENAGSESDGSDGSANVTDVRDELAAAGRDLAYTTVATLVRILTEKGFLEQTTDERPFLYRPVRSFEEVSDGMIGDFINRVFGGSREQLLLRLFENERLTAQERAVLSEILQERNS